MRSGRWSVSLQVLIGDRVSCSPSELPLRTRGILIGEFWGETDILALDIRNYQYVYILLQPFGCDTLNLKQFYNHLTRTHESALPRVSKREATLLLNRYFFLARFVRWWSTELMVPLSRDKRFYNCLGSGLPLARSCSRLDDESVYFSCTRTEAP